MQPRKTCEKKPKGRALAVGRNRDAVGGAKPGSKSAGGSGAPAVGGVADSKESVPAIGIISAGSSSCWHNFYRLKQPAWFKQHGSQQYPDIGIISGGPSSLLGSSSTADTGGAAAKAVEEVDSSDSYTYDYSSSADKRPAVGAGGSAVELTP